MHRMKCRVKNFHCSSGVFLIGAFSLEEKSPTITVGSFFSWQSHSEWSFSYNSYLAYEVVFLQHLRNSTGPKGTTPLEYFRLCETSFEKKSPKGPPFNFLILSDRMDVEKSQRVCFQFFRHCETFSKKFLFIKGSPIHQYFDILKSFCYF